MDNDNTMVSMAEVDENMAIIQQKMSLMIDTHQNEINKLKKHLIEAQETIRKQGDQLIIFHAKEEIPHTPSSACAHAVLEVKNCEIDQLKEENERLAKSVKMLRKENATLKEGEIAHLGKIDLLKHQLAGGVLHTPLVVQDINGKDVKIPNEEECQQMFGVSQEEYIMLVKNSDCQY